MSDEAKSLLAEIQANAPRIPRSVVVQRGDNLWEIVGRAYEVRGNAQHQAHVDAIVAANGVTNPNHIVPGWHLVLPEAPTGKAPPTPPPNESQAIREANREVLSLPVQERETVEILSEMFQPRNESSTATAEVIGGGYQPSVSNVLDGLIGSGDQMVSLNKRTIGELIGNYEGYARGDIARTAYNRNRVALRSKLVGMNKQAINLTGGQGKALRSQVRKGASLQGKMFQRQTSNLVKLGRVAKGGNVVLAANSLRIACSDIGQAPTSQEKNEIFVDATTSTAAGIAVAVFLVATPVGWGTAIVLGVAGAAVSFGAGKGARALYRHKGQDLKIVETLQVTKLCKAR